MTDKGYDGSFDAQHRQLVHARQLCAANRADAMELRAERDALRVEARSALAIEAAARRLIDALDNADPSWRKDTLVADGDDVNDAWVVLNGLIDGH